MEKIPEIPELPERKEVIKDFFVGDTVILNEDTKESIEYGFKKGDIGIVSKDDTEESLKGWKVVDYAKKFKEALDQKTPEEISELFKKLVEIGKIKLPEQSSAEDNGENDLKND